MKKIMAFVLSAVLLLTSFVNVSFGAEEPRELAVNSEQMGLLYTLGISSSKDVDGIKNFNEFTRGEAAKYFCRMLSISPAKPSGYEAIYPDVSSEHRNYAYIKAMKEERLMIGFPNGRFGPDDPITVMDAATVVAKMLGYGPHINARGINYVINKTDLLEGIEVSDKIKSDEMYRLFYNALHTPAVKMTGVSGDGATLTVDENYLGAELLFGVVYAKGVVEGNANTDLEKAVSMHSESIEIDGTVYRYKGDGESYLGYNVDFYYKKNNSGTAEIIYVAPNSKNDVLVIKSEDIKDYGKFSYEYYNKSGVVKTVNISGDTDVVYNGIAHPSFSKEDMIPAMGQITLIDNDSDRKYDVLLIDAYEFCIAGNIDAEKKIFYDKVTGEKFDFSDAVDVEITFEGKEYPIDRIVQGNLLQIKRSKAESGCYRGEIVVRKDERTFVRVESVNGDTAIVGNVEYKIWDKLDADSKSELVLGNDVTLYFFEDTVVRVSTDGIGRYKYGYLLNVHAEGVLDPNIQFVIVNQNGDAAIYDMGNSIVIDGKSCKSPEDVTTALSMGAQKSVAYDSVNYPYAQPVAYMQNKNGQLSKLDTAYVGNGEDSLRSFSLDLSGSYTYNGYAKGIYDSTWTNLATYGNAVVFGIPENDRNDFDKYREYKINSSESGTKVDVFNIDDDSKIAKVVFLYKDFVTETYDYTDPIYLVKDICVELDDEGELGYSVTCIHIQKNVEEVYRLSVEVAADMEIGDVFRMSANLSGKIYSKEILFDKSKQLTLAERVIPYRGTSKYDGPLSYGYKFVYGTPILIKDGYMRMTKSVTEDSDFSVNNAPDNVSLGSAVIYQYTNVRGVPSVEAATQNDIKTYELNPDEVSEVLLFAYSNSINFILVIND